MTWRKTLLKVTEIFAERTTDDSGELSESSKPAGNTGRTDPIYYLLFLVLAALSLIARKNRLCYGFEAGWSCRGDRKSRKVEPTLNGFLLLSSQCCV